MTEKTVLETVYQPGDVERKVYAQWEESGAFHAEPGDTPRERTFTIVIPPPNVTGALHLGHALNNTLQDILIRYHRMRGFNTLWQPGTDHAGIATQAVVERRIRETEGKTRYELGATEQEAREELVRRIWEWKDQYESRILNQLKLMGCSCDWERTRFTLDDGLAKAVRHQFFQMFKDGLIFRGKRLVNWDSQLRTAVADDEVYHETVKGHFWHFKYPVLPPEPQASACADTDTSADDPSPTCAASSDQSEPEYVVIATTRPETMLGDTAVAVHPDPEGFFTTAEAALRSDLADASQRDKPALQSKLDALAARRSSHLGELVKLRDMARDGRKLLLPLVERKIPLILDEWANPTLGSGCVKITPAHDSNDYEVGLRHDLPMINVLSADGQIAPIIEPDADAAPTKTDTNENAHSDRYAGLTFIGAGRDRVVADMEARDLVQEIEDRDIEVGHSDRSKHPIEPYLSDQWFVKTRDVGTEARRDEGEDGTEGRRDGGAEGVRLGDGSTAPGLAQAAMDAVTDGRIEVFPPRYAKSYLDWLGEKRDWCISRQLWWGHRIPIWSEEVPTYGIMGGGGQGISVMSNLRGQVHYPPFLAGTPREISDPVLDPLDYGIEQLHRLCCWTEEPTEDERKLLAKNDVFQDPDVLDTWFSSALWPISTLGWPEETPHLKQYYPGSVLCTSRDIITNWVARMVMFGLYAMGDVPFDHVYIHPKILDGRGETMSKSKGNGVDPVDIIHTHGADALRYSMADMCTETQDIRMPVDYICPHCGKLTEQTQAVKVEEQARKSRGEKLERKLQPADCLRVRCTNKECGWEFATQWADDDLKKELQLARETSEKFEIGRNFCNKLWNAARFALMNLEGAPCGKLDLASLPPEDRWILARLSETIRRTHECLAKYQFAAATKEIRDFFWESLCDWYIELTKPRMTSPPTTNAGGSARQVLAFCLDQTLRLFHPIVPFITEQLWCHLNETVPRRGLPGVADLDTDSLLITAGFPPVAGYPQLDDQAILHTFAALQQATRGVRELRTSCIVSPKDKVMVTVVVPKDRREQFAAHAHILEHMAGIGGLSIVTEGARPKNAGSVAVGDLRIFVHDISDDDAERTRARKALVDVEKQMIGKRKKLSNEKFLANAKSDIIEAERGRLVDLEQKERNLQAQLAELDDA